MNERMGLTSVDQERTTELDNETSKVKNFIL